MFTMNNKKQQSEVFYKNSAFNGKHLLWSVFLIKFQVFMPAYVFSMNNAKFLKTPIFKKI